jgi:hypothetical protein
MEDVMVKLATSEKKWEEVEQVIDKHYYQPDLQAARALYSAVAAHRLKGPQVWAMLVAPPGSMKTELLSALDGLVWVHLVDQITPQTLISGQIQNPQAKKSPSLLHRIGRNGILICPDFSTILGMKAESRASVLADLRRTYDGQLKKEYGTVDDPEKHSWTGRLTLIVAVTQEIDRMHGAIQALGDRFVMIRWPRAGGVDAAVRAMNQDRDAAKTDLKKAVRKLFDSLKKPDPEIPPPLQVQIGALAELAVRARTHVNRNGYSSSKEIVDIPEAESPTRLAQQLAQLAKGSAFLVSRPEVNDIDINVVRRVALDCIPPIRRRIIEALIEGKKSTALGLPHSTRSYAEEELKVLGLTREGSLGLVRLSELAQALVKQADFLKEG